MSKKQPVSKGAEAITPAQQIADLQSQLHQYEREARIEAALESVRSTTMAMRKSEDLHKVVAALYEQMDYFNAVDWMTNITIFNEKENTIECWLAGNDWGKLAQSFDIKGEHGHPHITEVWSKWRQQSPPFHISSVGEEYKEYARYLVEDTGFINLPERLKKGMLAQEKLQLTYINMKYGQFEIVNAQEPLSSENIQIVERFAIVFEQSYTRYLDLQKAEALTRETQVELSLERIRAQAAAMKQSTDLLDVVVSMRREFISLGHEAHYFWHMLYSPDTYQKAMTSGDGTRIGFVMELPRHIHGDIPLLANWEKSDDPTVIYSMDIEGALSYINKMITLGDFENLDPQAPTEADIRQVGGLTFVMARTTHGEIGYSLPGVVSDPPSEDLAILVRFAGAFDLAHLRFLDLLKAEAQTRETQIELALEKVRNTTMAMQKSEELPDAANKLFLQVQQLGIPAWSAGYCIWTEDMKSATACMSSEGVIQKPFILPNKGVGYDFQEPFERGERFHIEELGGELIKDHYDFMRTLPIFGEILNRVIEAGHPLPTFQIFHICYFKYGYVMFITYESVPEAHDIFQKFGNVFEQTYTRFLDLQKAEVQVAITRKQNQEIQKAYKNLKATQAQLIQAEKMASLGELTAGIAHEIQNPLNFVNNFSDVSGELIDEAVEELSNNDIDEVKDLLSHLKGNLEKISHHGNRASSIVKGMLDHSRTSSGEKVPTDINALCDEYLRLAYHGLRAKDSSFNSSYATHFDNQVPLIAVVPQDIGRVLLNIINNAFYACTERSRSAVSAKAKASAQLSTTEGESTRLEYKPLVTITTRSAVVSPSRGLGASEVIEIIITDNGKGMSQETIDKVFQPFFTTKPTGQGTGLGMSISYDIITKGHGGELKVESHPGSQGTEDGSGTTFTIILPI